MNARPQVTRLGSMFGTQPTQTQTGFLSRVTRLGSAFTETAPVATDEPPSSPLPKVESDDVVALKAEIRRLKKAVDTQPEEQAAAALQDLYRMRDAEYAREDGGRLPVKRALSGAGIGKPGE